VNSTNKYSLQLSALVFVEFSPAFVHFLRELSGSNLNMWPISENQLLFFCIVKIRIFPSLKTAFDTLLDSNKEQSCEV
jgi:hypothetical protein